MSASATTFAEQAQSSVAKLGRRLAGARVERSLTQAEVAARARTSAAQVSEIESGKINARIDTIARVAQAVGLELTLRDPSV